MGTTESFALMVLVVSALGVTAVLSNHLGQWVRLPAPMVFLVGAAVAVKVFSLHAPPVQTVGRVVSIALVFILFDGGMRIGWAKFRSVAGPIVTVGIVGTFLTVAAAAVLVHLAFGLAWYISLLVATAVAPTDPAVVFSVLGQSEISGSGGTILEGESGANDPVGIALMVGLITAGSLSTSALAHVGSEFGLQMGVGAAVGIIGGRAVGWSMRRVPLATEGLYPLRIAASVLALFALATLAHGSGFLAVFVAGIVLGDQRAPYKREIQRFHSAVASLAEIVAFIVLGLTVNLAVIGRVDVWVPGLVLGVVLALVIRPLLVGVSLIPARLPSSQRNFVLFAGLKGAVPVLLGSYLLAAHVPGAERLYGIIVVVVIFSVVVQGGLVPTVARKLGVPTRTVELEPWALGVRLQDEPSGVYRMTVAVGSAADGCTIEGIIGLPVDVWISLVVRSGRLVPVRGDTSLRAGDDVLLQAEDEMRETLSAIFEGSTKP